MTPRGDLPDPSGRPAGERASVAETAANLSPDLLLLVDDQRRIVYANARFTELLGYPFLPFLVLDDLVETDSLPALDLLARRAEEGLPSETVDIAWRAHDRSGKLLETRVRVVNGQLAISAREVERVSVRQRRLADQAVLSRRISHDIKNLMTYVVACSELMRLPVQKDPKSIASLLDRSNEDFEAYLERLDGFSQPLTIRRMVDPVDLVAEVAGRLQRESQPPRHIVLSAQVCPPIDADRERLEAALRGLIAATFPKHHLTRATRLYVQPRGASVQIRIRVPHRLNRAQIEDYLGAAGFSPNSLERYAYALAAQVVALHGGMLRLAPDPPGAESTEFWIDLPSADGGRRPSDEGRFPLAF